MSKVIIKADGIDKVMADIDSAEFNLHGMGKKIAGEIAEALWTVTKNTINEMGLYDSGELYDSVVITGSGEPDDPFRVTVGADHAGYVENGTGPSSGRYVPDIDRRLVNPRREFPAWGREGTVEFYIDIGMHPGIRAYGYFESSVDTVIAFTDEQWMRDKVKDDQI